LKKYFFLMFDGNEWPFDTLHACRNLQWKFGDLDDWWARRKKARQLKQTTPP
jgi:hypothetical protein